MTHWTRKRLASFIIHTVIVIVPFTFSTVSALSFWHGLFQDWNIAVSMVAVLDALSLIGLVMYIMRIPSPFQALRHALPFISIVPLGLELYSLLAQNGVVIAGTVTVLATAVFVGVAWQCFTTIEELFISPVEAAREKIHAEVAVLLTEQARYQEVTAAIEAFRRPVTVPETLTITAVSTPMSKTQRVAQLALELGKSESTIWRMEKKGLIVVEGE